MHRQKTNIFIYGSLRDSRIFQSVSGLSSFAPETFSKYWTPGRSCLPSRPSCRAIVASVRTMSTWYAVQELREARIEGLGHSGRCPVLAALAEIDRYEGKTIPA